MFHFQYPAPGALELRYDDRLLLRHTPEAPALFLACVFPTPRWTANTGSPSPRRTACCGWMEAAAMCASTASGCGCTLSQASM